MLRKKEKTAMALIHKVCLTGEDRGKLHDLLKVGEHSARTIARGSILLLAHQGKTDDEIAQTLEIGRATVQRVRKRYCQKGLDHALNELPRALCETPARWKARSLSGGACL
jgi:FixJ family two-component response regulator